MAGPRGLEMCPKFLRFKGINMDGGIIHRMGNATAFHIDGAFVRFSDGRVGWRRLR